MRPNAILLLSLLSISLPAAALPQWQPAQSAVEKATLPTHLRGLVDLPPGSVTPMRTAGGKSAASWQFTLPDGTRLGLNEPREIVHPNGDVTVSGAVAGAGALYPVLMTIGADASFGTLQTPQGEFRFESWAGRGWLIDASHPDLRRPGNESDAVALRPARAASSSPANTPAGSKGAATATVDVLFVYTDGFASRYPGTASATRINHLVAVANQAFANSEAGMVLRAVGMDHVDYPDNNDNGFALEHLQDAGAGETVQGLETLAARRAATGADLVSMMRPHDVEVRGSCGIAFLFTGSAGEGYNVNSDGFDSWSLCDDAVFAHEVGHNVGAEHQIGFTSENAGFGTAFVADGKFHTIMGSFGSGHPDRNRRVLNFSNPDILCGGIACGIPNVADNARRLRDNMQAVSAFTGSVVAGVGTAPAPIDPDSDWDDIPDSADAFPFDPDAQADTDRDGVADNRDAFPSNAAESGDIDGDGIGDNADPDRDGDGTPNAQDALPDDPAGATDTDGDRVANAVDAFPANRNEWLDRDADGIGDNADPDADGDGEPDVADGSRPFDHDLLVVDATSRVLRFDGRGSYGGIELQEAHIPQAFGPRAGLAWDASRKRLVALVAGDVRRYDRSARTREAIVVESYADGPKPGLPSGLAQGFALDAQGTIYVADSSSFTLHRFDPVTGEKRPGGVFGDTPFFENTPRALTVAGRRMYAIDRAGRMSEIDLDSAAVLRRFSPRINGAALTNPSAMAITPDGATVFVTQPGQNRVVRIDTSQSSIATVFVPPTLSPLAPGGLAIDPDGSRLYVAGTTEGTITLYDTQSGARAYSLEPPAGTLGRPYAMTFAPKVKDRYPLDPARRFRPVAGGWSSLMFQGTGIDLQTIGSDLAMTWYTYDDDGQPTWYLAVGPLASEVFEAPLLRMHWTGSQAVPTPVGSVRLTFDAENSVQFQATLGSEEFDPWSMTPVRAGHSSETQFPTAAWYSPEQPGWGITYTRNGDVDYLVAFVYDSDGEPRWAIGGGEAGSTFTMTHPVANPPLNPAFPQPYPIGTATFTELDLTTSSALLQLQLEEEGLLWNVDIDVERATDTPTGWGGAPILP